MFQAIPLIREIEEMLTPSTLRAMTCAFYLFIRQPHGSEVSPAARNTLDSARIPRASKLLICGLLVLPQSSVATPCLNASVSWPACVGERH